MAAVSECKICTDPQGTDHPDAQWPSSDKSNGSDNEKHLDFQDTARPDIDLSTSVSDVFDGEAIDPVLSKKMALVNSAIDEMGMTTFHWKLLFLNGFGYAVDSVRHDYHPKVPITASLCLLYGTVENSFLSFANQLRTRLYSKNMAFQALMYPASRLHLGWAFFLALVSGASPLISSGES